MLVKYSSSLALEQRRGRGDLIAMYRMISGLETMDRNDLMWWADPMSDEGWCED